MGKALVFIVAASTLGGSLLLLQTQQTGHDADAEVDEHGEQLVAREAARSGLAVGLGDVKLDFDPQQEYRIPSGTDANSSYDVEVEATDQATMRVVSTGRSQRKGGGLGQAESWGKVHQIQAELTRVSPTGAALIVSSPDGTATYVGNTFEVSGRDSRPGTVTGTGGLPPAGKGTSRPAVLASNGDLVSAFMPAGEARRARVNGAGGEGDVVEGTLSAHLAGLIDGAKGRATDVVDHLDVWAAETYGSPTEPRILHVRGDARFDVSSDPGYVGHGLLVVEGDLEMAGHFEWNGIVIARKEGAMSVVQRDDARIYGSLILDNPEIINSMLQTSEDAVLHTRFLQSEAGYCSAVFLQRTLPDTPPEAQPAPEMLFAAGRYRTGGEFTVPDVITAGTQMNFFIGVDKNCSTEPSPRGSGWRSYDVVNHTYNQYDYDHVHFALTGEVDDLGLMEESVWGMAEQSPHDGRKWRIAWEDQHIRRWDNPTSDDPAASLQATKRLGYDGNGWLGTDGSGYRELRDYGNRPDFSDQVIEVWVEPVDGTREVSTLEYTLRDQAFVRYSEEAVGRTADLIPAIASAATVQELSRHGTDPTKPLEIITMEGDERGTICHNGNTLTLPLPAVEAHRLRHGDPLGACGVGSEPGNGRGGGHDGNGRGGDNDRDDDGRGRGNGRDR